MFIFIFACYSLPFFPPSIIYWSLLGYKVQILASLLIFIVKHCLLMLTVSYVSITAAMYFSSVPCLCECCHVIRDMCVFVHLCVCVCVCVCL